MNPVHPDGYLITPKFRKGGITFEVRETQYGSSYKAWDAIDALYWTDKNNVRCRTKISRRQLKIKFGGAELLTFTSNLL